MKSLVDLGMRFQMRLAKGIILHVDNILQKDMRIKQGFGIKMKK